MITLLTGNEVVVNKDIKFFVGGKNFSFYKDESFTIKNVWFDRKLDDVVASVEERSDINLTAGTTFMDDACPIDREDIIEWPAEPEPNE